MIHTSCLYRCLAVPFYSYLLSNTFYSVLSQIKFCRNLRTFQGKLVFAEPLLGSKKFFVNVRYNIFCMPIIFLWVYILDTRFYDPSLFCVCMSVTLRPIPQDFETSLTGDFWSKSVFLK